MSRPNNAAAHIGRIGALAVALGVGAAVVTGTGVAQADASDTDATGASDTGTADATAGQAASAPAASTPVTSAPSRRSDRGANARKPARQPSASASAPASASASTGRATTPLIPDRIRRSDTTNPASAASSELPQRLPDIVRPSVVPVMSPAKILTSPAPISARVPAPVPVPITVAPLPVVAAVAATPQSLTAPIGGWASRLLDAVGLNATTVPGAPLDSTALWALLAWTRRDLGSATARTVAARTVAASAAANAGVASAAVVATPPTSLASTPIGWVTGQRNSAFPGSTWTQTNNTRWANVYGTDLGVMWVNGENGLTQVAFGDTFSGANMTGNWRSNVLLLSDDTQLYDGLSLINTGPAGQFIPAARNQVFFIGSEVTNIPSAAVYANGENYVNYFSVKSWDTPGRWTTNYSAISMYDEATDKWVLQPSTVRSAGWFRSSTPYRAGDQNFQQAAYVLQPESKVEPGGTRYVYAFGTPAGRTGSAFLSRVPEGAMTDLGQYEYWDGATWVRDNPAVAAPIIGDSPNSAGLFGFVRDVANNPGFFGGWFAGLVGAKTGGNVSEMSVQYNEYLDKYVVMYGNGQNNVILRTADTPEGPWSAPVTVATSFQYPGLYAPLIHPLSGTGALTDSAGDPDLSNLYWNMSLWGNYNVVLMQTDLAPLNITIV